MSKQSENPEPATGPEPVEPSPTAQDAALDEALEDTFPASDPIAPFVKPSSTSQV